MKNHPLFEHLHVKAAPQTSYATIDVLHEICGLPWCEVTAAYVYAAAGREGRVVISNGTVKLDAIPDRVTVHLDETGCIRKCVKEAIIATTDIAQTGAALSHALKSLAQLSSASNDKSAPAHHDGRPGR